MPEALEAGTLNSHGIAGLGAAMDWIRETGTEQIRKREQQLMWRFYDQVKDSGSHPVRRFFPGRTLSCGDSEYCRDGFGRGGHDPDEEYGISVRAGGHCAPLMHKALGTEKTGAVRFSFSYFNTEEEVDTAAGAVKELAAE